MQVMLKFTLEEEAIINLQSSSNIQLQSARFEKAYTRFFKEYLESLNIEKSIETETIGEYSNYKL